MATSWTYIPIVGDYSAQGLNVFVEATFETIPRNTDPAQQGDAREGVLKWYLLLDNADPTVHADDAILAFVVRTPFQNQPFLPGQTVFSKNLQPLVVLTPSNGAAANQKLIAEPTITGSPAALVALVPQLAAIAATLNTNYLYSIVQVALVTPANAQVTFQLTIDFSHSSIN